MVAPFWYALPSFGGDRVNHTKWMLAASLSLAAWGAQALQITSLSPQGEVARIRQVVAKFDTAAVYFGDP